MALALRADLGGPRERSLEGRLDGPVALDLAADIADQPTQAGAQEAHLSMVAVELLGVCITSRHHRRLLGDAQIGLPQPRAMVASQAIEPLDRRMQQLGGIHPVRAAVATCGIGAGAPALPGSAISLFDRPSRDNLLPGWPRTPSHEFEPERPIKPPP